MVSGCCPLLSLMYLIHSIFLCSHLLSVLFLSESVPFHHTLQSKLSITKPQESPTIRHRENQVSNPQATPPHQTSSETAKDTNTVLYQQNTHLQQENTRLQQENGHSGNSSLGMLILSGHCVVIPIDCASSRKINRRSKQRILIANYSLHTLVIYSSIFTWNTIPSATGCSVNIIPFL